MRTDESLLDSTDGGGIIPGFFSMLSRTFGEGAFDRGGTRFTRFIADGSTYAGHFQAAWDECIRLLGLAPGTLPASGPLRHAADLAGLDRGSERLQRALTMQIEQAQRDHLHAEIMATPLDSGPPAVIRQAWVSEDRFSSQFISAWPTHELTATREVGHVIGPPFSFLYFNHAR